MAFVVRMNIGSPSSFSFASVSSNSLRLFGYPPVLKYSASLSYWFGRLLPWLCHGYSERLLFSSIRFSVLQIILMTYTSLLKTERVNTFYKFSQEHLNCLNNCGDIDERRIFKGHSSLFSKFRFLFEELVSWKWVCVCVHTYRLCPMFCEYIIHTQKSYFIEVVAWIQEEPCRIQMNSEELVILWKQ